MLRFSANLSLLFTETAFPQRFARAAAAGFRGVECMFPYDWPAGLIAQCLETHDLTQVLFNLPPGDWGAGERGLACLPGREGEFQEGVGLALAYARALGCRRLNCLAGIPPGDADGEAVERTLAANLRFAADALDQEGVQLLVEPLNNRDLPGFHLVHLDATLDLLAALEHPNIALQYDVYHRQIMEGDVIRDLAACIPRIGHIQIADHPGRHEPGSGGIDFPRLFRLIEESAFTGWVGCEYHPAGETLAGLTWLRPYS
jgi:hydroxypyruvate isomerase